MSKACAKFLFEVYGIPDTTGLRIKTTNPTGLYVSSRNADSAKWYFETVLIRLAERRGMISCERGGGFGLSEKLNWPAFIESGKGEVSVVAVTAEEALAVRKVGRPVVMVPVEKLQVDLFLNDKDDAFFLVRDPGNMVDGWLAHSIEADLKGAQ